MVNYINRTTTVRNSTGRGLFNVNVVFANGLLIVKQHSSSEELSFCNKLTGNFWGFDLQTTAKCPFPYFRQVFPFAMLYLLAKWVELPQWIQHLLEGKSYLCYFQPCHTSLHFIRLHNNELLFGKFHGLGLFDNYFKYKIGFLQ